MHRVALLSISTLIILLLAVLGLMRFTLVIVTVRNQSMAPTFIDGDRALVFRYYPTKWLRRSQIVLVGWPQPHRDSSSFPFGCIPFIKRIIGLPGDTLAVPDITSADLDLLTEAKLAILPQRIWTVPEKHLFVCGDNPLSAPDSRVWGPIPYQSVVGVVLMPVSRVAPPN
ncbi:MAG: signal peptidase I [Chloroflexales bacterium]|nr:signal peptidase I [Chloroflexales bacterium]